LTGTGITRLDSNKLAAVSRISRLVALAFKSIAANVITPVPMLKLLTACRAAAKGVSVRRPQIMRVPSPQ
jgi:hypothetical protein